MFSPYHASGFYCAPVTKGLLGSLVLSSVAFNIPLSAHRHWFHFTYDNVLGKQDIFKYLLSRLVFLDPKDIMCAGILLYHFRVFERRYGSLKYASYLLATFIISLPLEALIFHGSREIGVNIEDIPSGPWGLVFSLFVPFFNDIPRVAITTILGIPVTGKSIIYIVGLQMFSSSLECALLALCGVVSGLIYRNNVLKVKHWLTLPSFVGNFLERTIGKALKTPEPKDLNKPMGATIEIQRQQHMEQIEQQMAWAHLQQRAPVGNPFGFGLFGNNQNIQNGGGEQPQPAPVAAADPPPEEQIQQLVEMGFNRDSVVNALQMSNNDMNTATNILLHQ